MDLSLRVRFESLDLHDATLERVDVDWPERRCRLFLRVFDPTTACIRPQALEFVGLSSLALKHAEPWGPSSSILCTRCINDEFEIEMQSGDTIRISALQFELAAL